MEFGEYDGFGWIPGVVNKIETKGLPLPHIGWNDIVIRQNIPLIENIADVKDFYFVHSYVFDVMNKNYVVAETEYGMRFNSVICKDNIHGIQFHPEKSQKAGQLLLKNFMNII